MNKLNLIWTFQIKENKLYQLLEASQKNSRSAELSNSFRRRHNKGKKPLL
jgi:hypothetical protein